MKKLNLEGIDTIIFDLGKVIINLDMEATYEQLAKLFGKNYELKMTELNDLHVFTDYETGRISTSDFVNALLSKAKEGVTYANIVNAWNAMLGDIPDVRFDILENAKSRFKIYCLSNTNELHIEWIEKWLKEHKGIDSLNPFFHTVYYSHEMGQRKPDVEIFETVIKNHNLAPSKTVFIDDTSGHLVGAQQAGLNTFHLSDDINLEDIYSL